VKEIPKYFVDVKISETLSGDEEKSATGIIIAFGEKMFILTDYESVKDAVKIEVKFTDKTSIPVTLEEVDEASNVAILSVVQGDVGVETRKILEKAPFGNSDSVAKGAEIALIGSSIDYGTLTSVSEFKNVMDGEYRILSTDIISVGAQSGFLLNIDGKVVGMLSGTGLGEAFGTTDIINIVNRICNATEISYLGIYGETSDSENGGIKVTSVEDGSPAQVAGIKAGDIILKIESKKVSTMKDIQTNLEQKNKDDEITIEIENKGEISLILGGR